MYSESILSSLTILWKQVGANSLSNGWSLCCSCCCSCPCSRPSGLQCAIRNMILHLGRSYGLLKRRDSTHLIKDLSWLACILCSLEFSNTLATVLANALSSDEPSCAVLNQPIIFLKFEQLTVLSTLDSWSICSHCSGETCWHVTLFTNESMPRYLTDSSILNPLTT